MKNKIRYIYLVRHAETDWNSLGKLNSFTNTELNEKGLAEAKKLGQVFDDRFTVWTSPMSRAIQTAECLLPSPSIMPFAMEVNFGIFEGRTRDEILASEMANDFTAWQAGTGEKAESFSSVSQRIDECYKNLIGSPGEHIILVSHGFFIRMFICRKVLNIPLTKYRNFAVDNCHIVKVGVNETGLVLLGLNNSVF